MLTPRLTLTVFDDTVHGDVARGHRRSVGRIGDVRDRVVRTRVFAVAIIHHAGGQREHEQAGVPFERQRIDDLLPHHRAERRAFRLDGGYRAQHGHRFSRRPSASAMSRRMLSLRLT